MRSRLIALLSMATVVAAQTPHAVLKTVVSTIAAQPAAPVGTHLLTVPAGTPIPLTLINPVKKKSTKPGDPVRATVAFPVMSGMQVAIPAGSYVEGVVKQISARTANTGQPDMRVHFTRLVFANGYSVDLNANSAQAMDVTPALGTPVTELAQSTPTLPPLQNPGPSPAVVTGAVLGGGAAIMVLAFAIMHHQQSKIDYVLFDAGWQFQMVLESPLVIDAAQVAPVPSAPSTN